MLLLNVYAQISAIYGSVCEHLLSIKMYTCTLLFLLIIWCGCIATWTDLTIPLLILWNGAGLTVSLSLLYDMRRIERLFTAKL